VGVGAAVVLRESGDGRTGAPTADDGVGAEVLLFAEEDPRDRVPVSCSLAVSILSAVTLGQLVVDLDRAWCSFG